MGINEVWRPKRRDWRGGWDIHKDGPGWSDSPNNWLNRLEGGLVSCFCIHKHGRHPGVVIKHWISKNGREMVTVRLEDVSGDRTYKAEHVRYLPNHSAYITEYLKEVQQVAKSYTAEEWAEQVRIIEEAWSAQDT